MTGDQPAWQWLTAFAAGCLLLPLWPALPNPWWLAALIITSLLIRTAARFPFSPETGEKVRERGRRRFHFPANHLLRSTSGLLTAFFAGLFLSTLTAHTVINKAWPPERNGETITVTGKIAGLTETRERQFRFDLKPLNHHESGLPRRIRVSWYFPDRWPQAGETWEMELRMRAPAGRVNPGGFDVGRWMLAERIGATASVAQHAERIEPVRGGAAARARQRLSEWLQASTANLDAAALHRALSVADRGGISRELRETLRRTGTAHLLAISGLHIGMVFAVAALLAGWLGAPLSLLHPALDRRRMALIAGLLVATGYACLAGFTLPTRRALIMLAVVAGAFLLRRGIRPGHALLLALVAVLLIDPLAPLATGFWLSFAAVAVLIWGFAWRPGRPGWLAGLIRAQALIAVGMLPLNAGIFQQLVPIAIPANLISIPLVGLVILPMLLLSVAMMLLGLPFADRPLIISEQSLIWLTDLLKWLESLPAGWWATAGAGGLTLVLATLGALWLIAPRGIPARWLGLVLLLPVFLPSGARLEEGELDVWVMDAGQGFAVLLQTEKENWLFDTGRGDGEGADQVAGMVEPLLRRTGARGLDGLILSHDNSNHIGGLHSVLERLQPETVLSGPDLPFEPCLAGTGWRVDGVDFRILHPGPGLPDLGGDSACVLSVETAAGRIMIAGAAGAPVGDRLARHDPDPGADVLVTTGSRLSKSPDFLNAVNAHWWIAGSELDEPGSINTDRCGAIRIRFRTGRAPEVEAWRDRERRFWRNRCEPRE